MSGSQLASFEKAGYKLDPSLGFEGMMMQVGDQAPAVKMAQQMQALGLSPSAQSAPQTAPSADTLRGDPMQVLGPEAFMPGLPAPNRFAGPRFTSPSGPAYPMMTPPQGLLDPAALAPRKR